MTLVKIVMEPVSFFRDGRWQCVSPCSPDQTRCTDSLHPRVFVFRGTDQSSFFILKEFSLEQQITCCEKQRTHLIQLAFKNALIHKLKDGHFDKKLMARNKAFCLTEARSRYKSRIFRFHFLRLCRCFDFWWYVYITVVKCIFMHIKSTRCRLLTAFVNILYCTSSHLQANLLWSQTYVSVCKCHIFYFSFPSAYQADLKLQMIFDHVV